MECPHCHGTGQIKATLGMKLKAFRSVKGAKVEAVATATGLSTSMISSLENDNSKNPGLNAIVTLAKYYNASVDDLISENGDD